MWTDWQRFFIYDKRNAPPSTRRSLIGCDCTKTRWYALGELKSRFQMDRDSEKSPLLSREPRIQYSSLSFKYMLSCGPAGRPVCFKSIAPALACRASGI